MWKTFNNSCSFSPIVACTTTELYSPTKQRIKIMFAPVLPFQWRISKMSQFAKHSGNTMQNLEPPHEGSRVIKSPQRKNAFKVSVGTINNLVDLEPML